MSVIAAPASLVAGDRRRWAALVVVCIAQLMNALDSTIVNVALPAIQHDLRFSQASLTWVVNGYLIAFGSFLLLAGRLGDLIGRRRVFLAGIVLFAAASAACALSQDQAVLVTARFLQGVGGALSSSVIVAIIVTEFPDPLVRARAMGVYIFVAVSGGSIGLLVGGTLTQAINWHWIFLINLPIGLAALLLGARLIAENDGIGLRHGVDVLGSVLVTTAMMAGIYAIVGASEHGWASPHTAGFGGLAVTLLAVFVLLEARLANPIMPLAILRIRSLVSSSVVRGLATAGIWSAFFIGALYLERVLGYGPTSTGLAFVPQTLVIAALSLGLTNRVVSRIGARPTLAAGLTSMIAGLAVLAHAGEHATYFPTLFLAFVLLGTGGGLSFMPLLAIAMSEVPQRDAGLASGIISVSMQISAAIGLAALGTISTDRTRGLLLQGYSLTTSLAGGYELALTIAAGSAAAGLVAALTLLRPTGAWGRTRP